MDTEIWLDDIHRHYGRVFVTPVYVAAEILLGLDDPRAVARSIIRRGIDVGDDAMAATTEADVADAVQELVSLGYLAEVFSAACPHTDHDDSDVLTCESLVLELRMPD